MPITKICLPDDDDGHPIKLLTGDRFGGATFIGGKPTQEDCLFALAADKGFLSHLSNIEIAHRLYTLYLTLNAKLPKIHPKHDPGTTAVTVVVKEKEIVTASVGDAAAFIVIRGERGKVLAVKRLTGTVHTTDAPEECERVEREGGKIIGREVDGEIIDKRVSGVLVPTRSLGDRIYKGVVADPDISLFNVDALLQELEIAPELYRDFLVLACSDGLTDAAFPDLEQMSAEQREAFDDEALKTQQERYLFQYLHSLSQHNHQLYLLAMRLNQYAMVSSADNISNVMLLGNGIIGDYDGHGGKHASCFVANNVGFEFSRLCNLPKDKYAHLELSVNSLSERFAKFNPHIPLIPVVSPAQQPPQGASEFTKQATPRPISPNAYLLLFPAAPMDDKKQQVQPNDKRRFSV